MMMSKRIRYRSYTPGLAWEIISGMGVVIESEDDR